MSEGSTIIGESTVVSGNVSGEEDLTVRGRIEGTVTLTKSLLVEAGGVVKADVQVKTCIVSGAVIGNVTATESVEIAKEGRMVGDITAPRVIIVDGGRLRGRIDMGEVEVEGESSERAAARPSSRPAATRPAVAAARERDEQPHALHVERSAAPVKAPALPVAVAMGSVKRKVVVRRK